MELQHLNHNGKLKAKPVKDIRFIEANTQAIALNEIQNSHIIPVFVKDNTPLVSQADFILNAKEIVEQVTQRETLDPAIRVSHPIKGRIFEARNKKASELQEHEKTIYYERMAWICEIPSISETINGKELNLTFGGVKAYNLDSLNNKYGAAQHFKFFMGFKVKVCTNLCIWSDELSHTIVARNLDDLNRQVYTIVDNYKLKKHLEILSRLEEYELSEKQFATLLGRVRMYNHIPRHLKQNIPPFLVSDSQINSLTRAYYGDEYFKPTESGKLNLWNMYNLLTEAVKSSYIDTFMDRNANAFDFSVGISKALEEQGPYSWFLS